MPTQSFRSHGVNHLEQEVCFLSTSNLGMITSVWIQLSMLNLQHVAKPIEFCRKCGVFPDNDLKDCIHCNNKDTLVTSAFSFQVHQPHNLCCNSCNKRICITYNTTWKTCRRVSNFVGNMEFCPASILKILRKWI